MMENLPGKEPLKEEIPKKGHKFLVILIVVICLIVLAVVAYVFVIPGIIMNMGRSYVAEKASIASENTEAKVSCTSDVKLEFLKISGTPSLCYNYEKTTRINFTIQNNGKLDITGLKIEVTGSKTASKIIDLRSEILSMSRFYRNTSIDFGDAGVPVKIRVIPQIEIGGNAVYCEAQAIGENMSIPACAVA